MGVMRIKDFVIEIRFYMIVEEVEEEGILVFNFFRVLVWMDKLEFVEKYKY